MAQKSLSQFDLAHLRLITNTAAALSETHIQRLRAFFPQATLYWMYGLTECKRVTYLPPEQPDLRPTSVGRGMPNEELWLVDDEGRRMPNGSVGELVIRGSHMCVATGAPGRDRAAPEAGAAAWRIGALFGRPVPHRCRGLAVLRGAARRHQQNPRREGQPAE